MSAPLEHTFVLSDALGEEHTYTVTRHRGSEGMTLMLKLTSAVVRPLASLVGPQLLGKVVAAQRAGKDPAKALAGDAQLLGSLDLEAVAGAVQEALAGLPPALVISVLRYTNRDGKPLVSPARKASREFDQAYAGNYMELLRALWEVCRYNAFFPGLSTISGGKAKAPAAAPETPESDD